MDFNYDIIPDEDNRNYMKDDHMDRLFPRYFYTNEIDNDPS